MNGNSVFHTPFSTLNSLLTPQEIHQLLHLNDHDFFNSTFELKSKRLGHYFESLLKQGFEWSSNWNLIGNNIQVFEEKKTIGEFDFILKHTHNQIYYHLESTVKFYLQFNNTNWIGPNPSDTLAIKENRLSNHQLQLSNHESSKAILSNFDIENITPICWSKGILFHNKNQPSNPEESNNKKHYWTHLKNCKNTLTKDSYWLILEKQDWIGVNLINSNENQEILPTKELIDRLKSTPNFRHKMIAKLASFENYFIETERWMIIYDSWPKPF